MATKRMVPTNTGTPLGGGTGSNNIPNLPPNFDGFAIMGGGGPGMPNAVPTAGDPLDYLVDYNSKFATTDKVLFRDAVIEQTISILIGKNKPNALLIGPAGAGKTAIVETIAGMLANNDPLIPNELQGYTIYEMPLSSLISGTGIRGELEAKIATTIDFLKDPANKAIVFIDEIHQLVSGRSDYDTIAQNLKPALARGDIKVIGATTLQEARHLMDDPAFNRRFSRIIVDELTQEQTVEILKTARPGFIAHYNNIVISDDVLKDTAILADQYRASGQHRPDNALTLLDRAIGESVVARQKYICDNANDPIAMQMIQSTPDIVITSNRIRKTAIALATGNSKRDVLDMQAANDHFAKIKGQDEALNTLKNIMQRMDLNLFPKNKPTTMLFVGPSGVGKTEVSKLLAQEVTGQKPIILNMTEYSNPATINRIIGSPAGYVGNDSNAELPFDSLESNPYSVILLDEFEKACSAVQRLFFSVFDEGTLTDNHGKQIDFSKSVIIATTNAGNEAKSDPIGFSAESTGVSIKDLTKSFDAALLNRFNYILNFKPISTDVYRAIAKDTYAREIARIKVEHKKLSLPDEIPTDVLEKIVKDTYAPEFGARPIGNAIQKYIENEALANP